MDLTTFQKVLTYSTIGFYLLALAFDLTVSYSVYSIHSEYFFNLERNDELIQMIRVKAIPWTMVSWFFVAMSPLLFYNLEMKFNRDVFNYLLVYCVFITLMIATLHFKGGLSWWKL